MMTEKTIREIIESYQKKDVPQEVKTVFERWLSDRTMCEEKDIALEEIWNDCGEAETEGLENPADIIAAASEIEKTERRRYFHTGLRDKLLYIVSAVAACLAVVVLLQHNLYQGQEVCLASSASSKGEFDLPDGSKVWLNKGSRLYYNNGLEGKKRMVRLEGEGCFDIVRSEGKPFIVNTGDVDVKVLGTRFTCSAYPESPVSIYLQEGRVEAAVRGGDAIEMTPDHAFEYDRYSGKTSYYEVNASDHTSWVSSRLEFTDKSLYDILQSLEHWYCVEIRCSDAEKAKLMRLSMTVRQEPLEEIMSAIGELTSFDYTIDGDIVAIEF